MAVVASIVGLQEVRGDSGGAVMNNLEPHGWPGQYGFVEHMSHWQAQRPLCGEEPHKR